MHARLQITSIGVAVLILIGVFELVRRRRLGERYALLWIAAASALLVLAVWKQLLYWISSAVGIAYPPNALFVIAFGFVLLLLLNSTLSVSRLSNDVRLLAQKLALLEAAQPSGDVQAVPIDLPTKRFRPRPVEPIVPPSPSVAIVAGERRDG